MSTTLRAIEGAAKIAHNINKTALPSNVRVQTIQVVLVIHSNQQPYELVEHGDRVPYEALRHFFEDIYYNVVAISSLAE